MCTRLCTFTLYYLNDVHFASRCISSKKKIAAVPAAWCPFWIFSQSNRAGSYRDHQKRENRRARSVVSILTQFGAPKLQPKHGGH